MTNLLKAWPALFLLSLSPALTAQEPAPALDAILARVRANIAENRASVPNFACDESVDSQRLGDGKIKEQTRVQSSFRITRTVPDAQLHETRVKNTIDGKPAKTGQKVSLPYTYRGGFADELGVLKIGCMEYRLGDSGPAEGGKIVILFGPRPPIVGGPVCVKNYAGKAVIDPVSFQVSHLEHRQEDIEITGWMAHVPFIPIPSKRNVAAFTADYAPVTLGDRIFWLPSRIVSTISDKSKPLILSYDASYSNYHRFTATVTIGTPGPPSSPE